MTSSPVKSWWANPNRAGSGTARLVLPDQERPVAAGFGRVASVAFGVDRGPGTPIPTTIRVRDIVTGQVVAGVDCPQGVDLSMALGDSALYYLAYSRAPAAALCALDFASSSVTTLVEDRGARRGALVMSPSGQTLAFLAAVGDFLAGVVRTGSRAVSFLPVDGIPFCVSDSQLFTRGSADVSAYELSSGNLDWVTPDTLVVRGYVTSDGRRLVVQTGFDPTETSPHGVVLGADVVRPAIAVIDTASGALRQLAGWDNPPAPSLWIALSDDEAVALVGPSREGAPIAGGLPINVATLDLTTGAVQTGGFSLVP